MALIYYWRGDNYRRDLDFGAGYHLNQANPLMHEIGVGDSLWAFTRRADGVYVLAADLIVSAKTLNPRDYRYGRYRVWGDLQHTRYFSAAGQPDITNLIRSLTVRAGGDVLGRAFQGHAAVRRLGVEDHHVLTVYASNLPLEPRARLIPEERLEALLLSGDQAAVDRLIQEEHSGLVEQRQRYLRQIAARRNRQLVEQLQQLYGGRCQLCSWSLEKAIDAADQKREAVGVLSHSEAESSEYGSHPEECHIQAVLKPESFNTLVSALQAGRIPNRVTARVRGLEHGWEPDGYGKVWDTKKTPHAPVVELSFGILLTALEPGSTESDDEESAGNIPASGADIRRLQEVTVQQIDLLKSSMWKAAWASEQQSSLHGCSFANAPRFRAPTPGQRERLRVVERMRMKSCWLTLCRRAFWVLIIPHTAAVAAQPGQSPTPNPSPRVPHTWTAFKMSADPQDKKLVAAIEKMQWWDACRDWGREWRSKKATRRFVALREFLVDAQLINGPDLMRVFERQVVVGMTSCGVYASIGKPEDINYTTTALGTRAQMIYGDRELYVYTEAAADEGNGIVTAIQE